MPLKKTLRALLRNRGVEIDYYRKTFPARRQRMLTHYGVDLLVDVGGNDGRYGVDVRLARYTGRILSLEPASAPYRLLAAAAAKDPRWEHRQLAVGAERGTLTLNISESALFSSALPILDVAVEAASHARYVGTEEVPVERLDDLLAGEAGPLMVKVDVQGFEAAVFDGAPATLDRAVLVEVELSPQPVYEGQELLVEAVQRLERHGLTLALVENVFPEPVMGRAMQMNGLFARL